MTADFLFYLVIGAAASGFVNGLAGFGTSLFALGWWLQVLTPVEAVATVLVLAIVSGVQGMVMVWREINWPNLLRFLIPAFIGIPIGLQLLSHINSSLLIVLVGVFLLSYGCFFSFKTHLPNLTRRTPTLDSVVGLISGVLGAVAGLSGALPTMLCAMRPWTKMQQRALIQPFNFIILGLSALLLAYNGGYSESTLKVMTIVLPISIIASIIGMMVFRRLNDHQYRRVLIVMMLISGLILLGKELLF